MRETRLDGDIGHVVDGVLSEVAMLPIDRQEPALVARALAHARVLDDPESVGSWVSACERLRATLAELHEKGDCE